MEAGFLMNVLYEWMENPFKIIEMGVLFRYPTPCR